MVEEFSDEGYSVTRAGGEILVAQTRNWPSVTQCVEGVLDGFNDYQLVVLSHHNVLLTTAFSTPSQIGTDNANK